MLSTLIWLCFNTCLGLICLRLCIACGLQVIVLARNAKGFQSTTHPKNVVKVTNPHAENINMNNVFRGIDIEITCGAVPCRVPCDAMLVYSLSPRTCPLQSPVCPVTHPCPWP